MIELSGKMGAIVYNAPKGVDSYILELVREAYGMSEIETETWCYVESMELFGGSFFILEKEEDLKQVKAPMWDPGDGFALGDLTTEQGNPAFDCVAQITHDGRMWLAFLVITNNSGGHTYFVPQELITENVERLHKLNERA